MTPAQKQKKMEKEIYQIDIVTIAIMAIILVVCIILGITIGKLLYDLAIANA